MHEGDTLSQIAKMFNVSVNTIVWANDIKNGSITPGQSLVILPVTGVKVVVKTGDTLQSIAKKYGGDVSEIVQFNGLDAGVALTAGDELIIPNVDAPALTAKPSTSSVKNSKTVASGYYMQPVNGRFRRTQGLHGHNGIDEAGAPDTQIVAAAAGTVIVSKNNGAYNGGYGNYIVISHPNGTQTLYGHLSRTAVGLGVHVAQGQLIGYMGNTGHSTGTHLHFEVRGARNPF